MSNSIENLEAHAADSNPYPDMRAALPSKSDIIVLRDINAELDFLLLGQGVVQSFEIINEHYRMGHWTKTMVDLVAEHGFINHKQVAEILNFD